MGPIYKAPRCAGKVATQPPPTPLGRPAVWEQCGKSAYPYCIQYLPRCRFITQLRKGTVVPRYLGRYICRRVPLCPLSTTGAQPISFPSSSVPIIPPQQDSKKMQLPKIVLALAVYATSATAIWCGYVIPVCPHLTLTLPIGTYLAKMARCDRSGS